jgi:hypothetical protein
VVGDQRRAVKERAVAPQDHEDIDGVPQIGLLDDTRIRQRRMVFRSDDRLASARAEHVTELSRQLGGFRLTSL